VIQPFDDGGKFDKRYTDVFAPAIRDAGLDPYRVDADPTVSIPIEEIQNGIRRASLCFADITLDNPNVWFELGYALASDKEICLVCSEERTGKYPFDVQHRTITKYRVESKRDFETLQSRITDRLKAMIDKSVALAAINAQSPIKEPDGLLQHEMMVLCSIVENRRGPGMSAGGVSHVTLREDLERLGYNNLALNIGIAGLIEHGMITFEEGEEYNGNYTETYTLYNLQPEGMKWVTRNYDRFNLKAAPRPERKTPLKDVDDEIPF
jgi:hypothetical protein